QKYMGRAVWFRTLWYASLCKSFGEKSRVLGKIKVLSPERLSIGKNTAINHGCFLNAQGTIEIGDHVAISPFTIINSGGLDYSQIQEKRSKHLWKKVIIHDGVWIGSGAIINPGVEIGENSVVGAGAVVTKKVPP